MAEQSPICSRIKFRSSTMDGPTQFRDGCTLLVAGLRNYFADGTISHYWELDTTTPHGDYQYPSNPAPYDTASNKFSCITLKPKAGAAGGLQQRIFIQAIENVTQTSRLINGVLTIGYLPDGTFDAINGLNGTYNGTTNVFELTTPPTSWCPPRWIQGYSNVDINALRNYVDIVEYRDDPAIFTDPGQALLIQLPSHQYLTEVDIASGQNYALKSNDSFDSMNFHCLVGRVIQPFTRYHELAIGNAGDALMCGRSFNGQTSVASGNQIERYDPVSTGRNHSSVVRIAPNVWAGLVVQQFARGERQANNPTGFPGFQANYTFPSGNPEVHPLFVAGDDQSVRDGVVSYSASSVLGEGGGLDPGVYGYGKQWRSIGARFVRSNSYFETEDPSSQYAWYFPQGTQNATGDYGSGRVLLWNKGGATYYSTQYVAGV